MQVPKRITTEAQALAVLRELAPHEKLVRDRDGNLVVQRNAACRRCGGSGHLPYTHVEGGICFLCYGADTRGAVRHLTPLQAAREHATRARKAERKRAVAAAVKAQGWEWLARQEHAEKMREVLADPDGSEFVHALRDKLEQFGYLTEKQAAALVAIHERRASNAERPPAPSGAATVAGTVRAVRAGMFGLQLVVDTDEGWSATGPIPAAIRKGIPGEGEFLAAAAEALTGKRVRFDATLHPSRHPGAAFYKRPLRATLAK